MAEHIHKIFKFIDPPDTIALQQCIDAVDACFYPWERCVPELDSETNGKVPVVWADTGQGVTGTYTGGTRNLISLNNRYAGTNYSFTMLHEAGHMVDDTVIRDDQRKALVEKWHRDLDGPWDGYIQNGEEVEWSHNTPHTHADWNPTGWSVSDADYYHKPNEAFADAFVACFAPSHFPYKRFAHWSDDIAGVRDIILSAPTPPPPPKIFLFPNNSIYRLYRAVFLREPDRAGYDYWMSQLAGGMRLVAIADVFCTSTEFRNRYGSLNNWDFVKLLYRNILGREADQAGLNHWVNVLNNGYSRGFVVTQFSESQEFINKINNERKL